MQTGLCSLAANAVGAAAAAAAAACTLVAVTAAAAAAAAAAGYINLYCWRPAGAPNIPETELAVVSP